MNVFRCFLFLFVNLSVLHAQTTASTENKPITTTTHEIDWANFEKELEKAPAEPWKFQKSRSGNQLFIDFEEIGRKMSRLVLKSTKDDVVFEDNHLFDLPFNTIYELNLEKYAIGAYFVELHTYDNQIIRQEIEIK